MKKGDIYYANLVSACPGETCVQFGKRPVVLFCNESALKYSPVVTVLPITSKKKNFPNHVFIDQDSLSEGRIKKSFVLAEQIRTIDKSALLGRIGRLNDKTLNKVDLTVREQLAIV